MLQKRDGVTGRNSETRLTRVRGPIRKQQISYTAGSIEICRTAVILRRIPSARFDARQVHDSKTSNRLADEYE